MDNETFIQFKCFSTKAAAFGSRVELKLSDSERELIDILNKDEKLLEQERIPRREKGGHKAVKASTLGRARLNSSRISGRSGTRARPNAISN